MPADCGLDLAEWLERLTASAEVALDTLESEGRKMKQC
jgi:hypothetical protein